MNGKSVPFTTLWRDCANDNEYSYFLSFSEHTDILCNRLGRTEDTPTADTLTDWTDRIFSGISSRLTSLGSYNVHHPTFVYSVICMCLGTILVLTDFRTRLTLRDKPTPVCHGQTLNRSCKKPSHKSRYTNELWLYREMTDDKRDSQGHPGT